MSLMDIKPTYRALLGTTVCPTCGGEVPVLGKVVSEGPSTSDLTNPCHGHALHVDDAPEAVS